MSSVAGATINTTGGIVTTTSMADQAKQNQVALWVAGFMLLGLAGLVAIALLFKKRVEI